MGLKNPPQWQIAKLFKDSITVRKVAITTDTIWGTATTETDTDYVKIGQASYLSLEDVLHDITGELKLGDLRVFFPIFTDLSITPQDLLIFGGITWRIYRTTTHQALGKPAVQEILARRP